MIASAGRAGGYSRAYPISGFLRRPSRMRIMRDDREHGPGRQVERDQGVRVPGPQRFLLQPVLHEIEAVLVDDRPDIAHPRIIHVLIGNRLGPVIDEEHEAAGQEEKSDEAKQKSDHGWTGTPRRKSVSQALRSRARLFNAAETAFLKRRPPRATNPGFDFSSAPPSFAGYKEVPPCSAAVLTGFGDVLSTDPAFR